MSPDNFYNPENLVKLYGKGNVIHFPMRKPSVNALTIREYTIQAGEDLFSIAENIFGKNDSTSWQILSDINVPRHPNDWKAGDVLLIPEILSSTEYKFNKTQEYVPKRPINPIVMDSDITTVAAVCAVPTGVSYAPIDLGATFSWDANPDAVYFQYQYKIGVGGTLVSGITYGNTFTISGAAYLGQTIYFQVQAFCKYNNNSAYTSFINYTVPATGPACATITSYVATVLDSNRISVAITATPTANTIGYNIYFQLTGNVGSRVKVFVPLALASSLQILVGLSAGTSYDIFITSVCLYAGIQYEGTPSATVTRVTASVCGILTGLVVDSFTDTQVIIKWNATVGAVSYQIKLLDLFGTVLATYTTTSLTYTITGLLPGTTHKVSVHTICAASEGSEMVIDINTTLTPCPIPVFATLVELAGAVVSGQKYRRVQAVITAPYPATTFRWYINGVEITSGISNLGSNIFSILDTAWSMTTVTIGVQSICAAGNFSGILSQNVALVATDPTFLACAIPTIATTSATDTTVGIQINNFNDYTTLLTVRYRRSGTTDLWTSPGFQVTDLVLPAVGVSASKKYEPINIIIGATYYLDRYSFKATTANAVDIVNGLYALMSADSTTGAPSLTHTITSDATGITLTKLANNSAITIVGKAGLLITDVVTGNLVTGLIAATLYEFQVSAHCFDGTNNSDSAFSGSALMTTLGATGTVIPLICNLPATLNVNNVSTLGFTASWDAAANATSYVLRVVRRSTSATVDYTITAPTVIQIVTGLVAGEIYDVSIQTVCAGIGSSSPFSDTVAVQLTNVLTGGGGGGTL